MIESRQRVIECSWKGRSKSRELEGEDAIDGCRWIAVWMQVADGIWERADGANVSGKRVFDGEQEWEANKPRRACSGLFARVGWRLEARESGRRGGNRAGRREGRALDHEAR